MRKNFGVLFVFIALFSISAIAQEYKVVTIVESIVPGGLGRSRIIDAQENVDYKQFTTERSDGKKSDQGDVKRSDVKIDKFEETKILNFYSIAGINFQNIASNDAMISSKINDLAKEGWQLLFVTSGVESDAGGGGGFGKNGGGGGGDSHGIFITRLIFKK